MMEIKNLGPGATIGVLGGGQLGRMVILEGRKMGYRFVTLDPAQDCPGSQVADDHIVGGFQDLEAAALLAERTDLIVYEFENIDPKMVDFLKERKQVPQGSQLLRITRHRLHEKQALDQAGIPVSPYQVVHSKEDLVKATEEVGLPGVLKTTTGGYDGKGQWMIHHSDEIEKKLPADLFSSSQVFIYEQFVPFIKELSVVVARSLTGEVKTFPAVVNLHRNHILHMTIAPATVEPAIAQKAEQLAVAVAEQLQVVGLVAVEMFLLPDGEIWVNELAPRPHNSGHYTFDACETSQFAQFLRAVLGLPLQSPRLVSPAVMVNILGEHVPQLMAHWYRLPSAVKVHWYGKQEAKKGRKMGHVTVLAAEVEEALALCDQLPLWSPLTEKERAAVTARCTISEGVEERK